MKSFQALVALALVGLAAPAAPQQPSLAEVVRRGPVELLTIHEYPPIDLPELVASADLIARVAVRGAKSYETEKARIATDYALDIYDVFSQEHGSVRHAGELITVRRDVGELAVNGQVVRAFEPNFPAFEVGEEYVFALKRDPESDTYFVLGGGQGAFRVGGDFVARQVTQFDG